MQRLLTFLAATCLVAALTCFVMAWRSAGHRHLGAFAPASSAEPDAWTSDPGPPPRLADAARIGPPVRVSIPAIGLTARVVPIGLDAARHLSMPSPEIAGWYRPRTPLGGRGPAVLVGHVDSDHGPAVFYRLSGARRGHTVRVERANGSMATYTIGKITVVSKTDFPSQAVYAPTDRATIRLITCTGPFDRDKGGYADSLIVWGHATPS